MTGWEQLIQLLEHTPGSYSLYVCDGAGRAHFAYQADVPRPSASLIKLPLALALYDAATAGQLDLDEELLIEPGLQVDGEGSLDRALPALGLRCSLRRLVAHALVESDNTASNALIRRIGMVAVNDWLADHGCQASRLQRYFMDLAAAQAGRQNWASASDMCRILLQIQQQPRYAELRRLMRQAIGADKLVAGLPPGTPVAHKLGDLPGVEHDAGIIETAHGPLIVAALSVDLPDPLLGKRTIAAAARLIYEAFLQTCAQST